MDDFIAFHGMSGRRPRNFSFGGLDTHPSGIHLGTLAQARMRAGGGTVLKVRVHASQLTRPPVRVHDRDLGWRRTLKGRVARGQSLLVYLNRIEGLPTARAVALSGHDPEHLAALSDRRFLQLAPEARDSWIVLDPALIQIVSSVSRSTKTPLFA